MTAVQYFHRSEVFALELGGKFSSLQLGYHTYGELNEARDNVIWVFHALTANSDVLDWWSGLFGEGDLFSPKEYFIVCVNSIGSPYGSTAPEGLDFPKFTVRDVARSQLLLAEHLGIAKIKVAIGGSYGGSQALEFALAYSGTIDHLILIACSARETAWGIAIHEAQRMALTTDSSFGQAGGGQDGLKAARAIGLLTYRTSEAFIETQSEEDDRVDNFKAASYLQYQGEKIEARFNALSYYYLHRCLDTHNLGRDRGGIQKALAQIDCPTLCIGIESDKLIPPHLQKQLAEGIPQGQYTEITSRFGHDGFLIETEKLTHSIQDFLAS
ncbi:homoserine O-acetyltransferase [Cryomorphaceae bacterium]|nr:homoserine O-acetyltransferase [Cryomorphaceae bacterium]